MTFTEILTQPPPVVEPMKDFEGNPIIEDGKQILHIPKLALDEDLDFVFGISNHGVHEVKHEQAGDIMKCTVTCWYVIPETQTIRHTSGSSGAHLTQIYNRFRDKSQAIAVMVPTLQSLAEKNAWSKLGKRFGRGLNADIKESVIVSGPAKVETKSTLPNPYIIAKMIDKAPTIPALENIKKQGLLITESLKRIFEEKKATLIQNSND